MPPKRKNKALPTKPGPGTPLGSPQAAGGIRTSSIKRRRSSVQGVKTSTSRLQPSEPLHMTTRKAAKAASATTSPAAPSVADGSSRRSSLNSVAHFQDDHSGGEDERPAKRSRVSTDSGSPPDQTSTFVSQMSAIDTPPVAASRAASNSSKDSSKRRRASADSSESSKTVSARPNGVLTRSESDLSDKQPRRKKRKPATLQPDPADAPPELTDASTPPGSPEQIPEVSGSQGLQNVLPTVNGEMPAKPSRRLPGRRRQPHPDINVEIDLRRQLNIKMGYRSLAKIQKTFLEELSARTTSNLENDAQFHKQGPEYHQVMAELDQRRQARLDQINAERQLRFDELERVRIAEEHIQREQYINRFEELRDNYILQCLYRMKRIEREMKAEIDGATDDEDNIIDPTHVDFPVHNADDRLGSRYASRSRAYVETERMLNEDEFRDNFSKQRQMFLAENLDFDDSIDTVTRGFAKFIGPDREESLAHYRLNDLADAAIEVETAPPEEETPKIIPNEQADALYMLALLSADRPPETKPQRIVSPPQVATPAQQAVVYRAASPVAPLSTVSNAISQETVKSSPKKLDIQEHLIHATPKPEPNGIKREPDTRKSETQPRLSTHRIMDLLNDEEVPLPKMRSSEPPASEKMPTPSPSRRDPLRMGDLIHAQEPPSNQGPVSSEVQAAPTRSKSPHQSQSYWSSVNSNRSSEPVNQDYARTPLLGIRQILDKEPNKKSEHIRGQEQGGHTSRDPSNERARRESVDRSQMAPPLPRPFSPDHPGTGVDSRRTSIGAVSASPSNAPQPYEPSPRDRPLTYPNPRAPSYDQSRSHWDRDRDRDRRTSSSQGPPPPSQYASSPRQRYSADFGRPARTPPAHQSPYPPPSAPPSLPSLSQPPPSNSLPPKPPGPPPINFRFAHYDPAPRQSFHQSSYPPVTHGPPPTQHYPPYPNYQGYIPPPGSFQAPPPPSPAQTHANAQYPPLKIHQYGGQPILPATLAPLGASPPSAGPYSAGPAPSYTAPPIASPQYSPPAPPPSAPQFEHTSSSAPPPPQERPDPQPRPRRQYRSYHAPGTEFRSYQGPNQRGRRS